ncbi:hypothetical protein KBC99_01215 [Candidatus Saccharibacteria bacterium]|nr:hypothetical protein [Candidatus Saccharibacteria bacterium]
MTRYLPRLVLIMSVVVLAVSLAQVSTSDTRQLVAPQLQGHTMRIPPKNQNISIHPTHIERTGGRLSVLKVQNLRTAVMAPDIRDDILFGKNDYATYTWGYISGSVFYRRNVTKLLEGLMNGPYRDTKMTFAAAVAGIACALLATPLGGAICAGAAGVTVSYLQDTLALARAQNACLRVRYFAPFFGYGGGVILSVDNGRWCRS